MAKLAAREEQNEPTVRAGLQQNAEAVKHFKTFTHRVNDVYGVSDTKSKKTNKNSEIRPVTVPVLTGVWADEARKIAVMQK